MTFSTSSRSLEACSREFAYNFRVAGVAPLVTSNPGADVITLAVAWPINSSSERFKAGKR